MTIGALRHDAAVSCGAGRADRPRSSAALYVRWACVPGFRRRHAGLGAAGERRASGGALVQVSPPARHPVGGVGGTERARHDRPGAGRVTPNLRATQVELYDGLTARSQNRFPSLRFDLGAVAGLAAPLLSAGFYYKSFMWPPSFWKRLYEPAIRRAAGLGRAPVVADPDRYLHRYAHCDVLIVGGGAAGLAAALGASATGARVILCDEQAELGGSLLAEPNVTIDGWPAPDWVREVIATLGGSVTLLPRTTAFGWYPGNMIGLVERVTDHLGEPARGVAARAVVAGAGRTGGAGDRGDRAADGVSRQRPSGRDAGRRGAHVSAPVWRQGRAARGDRDGRRQRLSRGDRSACGRRNDRRDRRSARRARQRNGDGGPSAGRCRSMPG